MATIGEKLAGIQWRKYFPSHLSPWKWQADAIKIILAVLSTRRGVVLEAPTGYGKTAIAIWFLNVCRAIGLSGARLIVTSTKALVDQAVKDYPGTKAIYGRHEYRCVYAHSRGKPAQADEIPCITLVKRGLCPHFVPSLNNIPKDVEPCEYYLAKREAEEGGDITVCTMAYFLLNRLFSRHPRNIAALALDEVDKLGEMARMVFTYDITDWHIKRLIKLVERYDKSVAKQLAAFLQQMIRIAQLKPAQTPSLLSTHEIERLIQKLELVEFGRVREKLEAALASGELDPVEYMEELTAFEQMDQKLKRYLHSFQFSVRTEERNPLNYVFAFYKKDPEEDERVHFLLRVAAFYVAPLIRSSLEGIDRVLAYSGTVASDSREQENAFRFETGIGFNIERLPSPYAVERMKIFMPTNTPNLAFKQRKPRDVSYAMEMAAEAIKAFNRKGIRVLVLEEAEAERQKFLTIAASHKLDVVTYGDGITPREALSGFKAGQGKVLLGVSAHYGRGVDLPDEMARGIILLRPPFKRPDDPEAQFEMERFPQTYRARWTLLASNATRQEMGRVIRNPNDFGFVIVISQHYQTFLPGALPDDRKAAWIPNRTMEECTKEAIEFVEFYRQAP